MTSTVALSTQPPSGLLTTARTPVALEGVAVDADITEYGARVTVTQRYRNHEPQPIEAVYVFPLDEAAAVCGFEAIVDGIHVVGSVLEREKAFETYDDAMEAGHGAYLLDQERPDVFTASVGNVRPGAEVLLRITYVAELPREGTAVRFVLPTTVAPRYAPATDQRGVGRTPAEVLNPPVAWTVPYGLDLTVRIAGTAPLRGVESPSHPIVVDLDGATATVRLAAAATALDRDFVLLVRRAEDGVPRALVEAHPNGQRTAMIAFEPQFETATAPSEVIFLIDRSGSMQGTSVAEARNALQLCLRSLTPGNHFNIVGFGSSFEQLFKTSRPYDDTSLAAATEHVQHLDANLGGTEILAPLEALLAQPVLEGLPRQLVILTDGEVTNTEAVTGLLSRHAATTRVFAFGIGASPSHDLVRGLARAGGGSAEFIHPGERIEAKVLRQFAKLLTPALSDVRVEWKGVSVQQAPHRPGAVFSGDRLVVYGLVSEGGRGEVCLTARGNTGPLRWAVALDTTIARTGPTLTTLAARAMIRDLEDGASALHDRTGSQQHARRDARIVKEIVRLGTTYGLASSHTSFVAVEERDTPTTERAELRRIPIALASGWGGTPIVDGLTLAMAPVARSVRTGAPAAAAADRLSLFDGERLSRVLESYSPAREMHAAGPRSLDRLVVLQAADGSWDLTEELATVLGLPLDLLTDGQPPATCAGPMLRRAWATALAIASLERHAAAESDEWELLARKAVQWLTACPAQPKDGRGWLEVATEWLEAMGAA